MLRYKNIQSANGFAHIVFLVGAITLFIITAVAWRVATSQNKGFIPRTPKSSKGNYSLNIQVSTDKSYVQQAYVVVYFADSIQNTNGCPVQNDSFSGDASITYKNDKEAVIDASQNVNPVKESDSEGYGICPDVVVPGFSKQLLLDSSWVRNSSDHIISLAGADYVIKYDKATYLLTIDHTEALDQTWFYAPGKVMMLYSHRVNDYSTCMSENELKSYAAKHKMTQISDTAPDVERAYRQFKHGANRLDDKYYSPNILINANSHVENIINEMQSKGYSESDLEECKVHVTGNLTVSQN